MEVPTQGFALQTAARGLLELLNGPRFGWAGIIAPSLEMGSLSQGQSPEGGQGLLAGYSQRLPSPCMPPPVSATGNDRKFV